MMITREPRHLDDAELMQLIDAEPDAAGALAAAGAHAAHADTCVACTARVQSLRDDAALVREWFDIAAFEVDGTADGTDSDDAGDVLSLQAHRAETRRNRARSRVPARPALPSGWLRAAAVLLLVAAPVAALPQLRQWLVDAVTGGAAIDSAPTAVEALSTQAATATFRFAPEGATLAVAFDALPAGGTLTVRRADGPEAELEIDGAAGAGPVLSGSGARLRNDASSAASYVLSVPSSVTSVTVTAGGRSLGSFNRAAIDGIVVLELAGRARS